MPKTANRPSRRERVIAMRAVTRKFDPGEIAENAQSAATENRRLRSGIRVQ
jgi:hypothetical protein